MTFLRRRVLSIQSHVVRGYVGNKAAVFPLQLLGHTVDFINTVQFTSMFIHEGERLAPEALTTLLRTLSTTSDAPHKGGATTEHHYLLTGYIGSACLLNQVVDFYTQEQQRRSQRSAGEEPLATTPETRKHSSVRWLCDPVLGDNGSLYVSPDLITIYRNAVLPLAEIVTPNHYELEWLSGKTVKTLDDARDCCRVLHSLGSRVVIVTSLNNVARDPGNLVLLASSSLDSSSVETFTIEFPHLDIYLGGTGDLFAAMLLHGLDRFHNDLRQACTFAINAVQGVIQDTLQRDPTSSDVDVVGSAKQILSSSMSFSVRNIPYSP